MNEIAGIILLGGASRRFGAPKHTARLGGRPLLAHAVENLTAQCGPMALATGSLGGDLPDLPETAGLRQLDDGAHAGLGPLAGILAGLAWLSDESELPDWLFSVPVDVPFLPHGLAPELRDAAFEAGSGSAYAATDGRHHAAIAIWHRSALEPIRNLLATGGQPVMAAHDLLNGVRVAQDAPEAFININTPSDLAAAEARLVQGR